MLPVVEGEDAFWRIKQRADPPPEPDYTDIEMPRPSATGFVCAFFAGVKGFALIWRIWWMVAVAAVGAYATFVVFASSDEDQRIVPAETVARIDRAYRAARGAVS